MSSDAIVLVGGGGHCVSVVEVIESEGRFRIAGVMDRDLNMGSEVSGHAVQWTDADIEGLCPDHLFCITIGHTADGSIRSNLYRLIRDSGGVLPVIVAASAVVSPRSSIQDGTVVMHQAMINAGAQIGANCIVNTKALIEHDAVLNDHCHASTGVVVNGGCYVGEGVMLGSNAVLRHGISVGDNAVIGAGAVVVEDVAPCATVVGNPAREMTTGGACESGP